MNTLLCNDQSASLLMKLYGVDPGSLKKNLELIYGKKNTSYPGNKQKLQTVLMKQLVFLRKQNSQMGLEF